MPRPATQRARGKSTQSKFLSDAANLVASVCATSVQSGATLLDNQQVQAAIFSFCTSLQLLYPNDAPVPADQATEIVNQLTGVDVLHAMLALLRSVTPSSLLDAGPGCADPSCSDGDCGPPIIASVLLMAFNMTTNLILSCDDEAVLDRAFRKLMDSQLVCGGGEGRGGEGPGLGIIAACSNGHTI